LAGDLYSGAADVKCKDHFARPSPLSVLAYSAAAAETREK
jgi:hypothetical protein